MGFRRVLIAVCAVLLVASLAAIAASRIFTEAAVLFAVLLLGLLFETRRYQRRFPADRQWQLTDEKFVDPTSGHLMQVRFDPKSGDREYIDLGPSSSKP